jgi:hypothetical protein
MYGRILKLFQTVMSDIPKLWKALRWQVTQAWMCMFPCCLWAVTAPEMRLLATYISDTLNGL